MMQQKFNMDDRGKLSWFLGIDFRRHEDQYTMSQERHIDTLLNTYNMADCNPVYTFAEKDLQLEQATDDEYECSKDYPYRQVIGSLICLMTTTCPMPKETWTCTYCCHETAATLP